ncbi:interference hedgehog-like isoform X2 [Diorhabda carinulata]|uniref:interference hedgehog-like isoform X2 n=1 Tax=Diorhabda carinulata TaxID=1163345 RepID=UPI0025A2CA93|nr:interference hedgehog-like isoform X2 [Diorhabda carinulata]
MDGNHIFNIVTILVVMFFDTVILDAMYMVSNPEPIAFPEGFETALTCDMNIEPDKFEWKFYPTDSPYNSNAFIDLSNSTFHLISENRYNKQRKKSTLMIQVSGPHIAGDYQCLAYYGAYVVASIPWRLTIAQLKEFPRQDSIDTTVTVGNTIIWRCLVPESNPEASIEYLKKGELVNYRYQKNQTKSLILPNVNADDTGIYTCRATNTIKNVDSYAHLNLRVVNNAPHKSPYFISEPKKTYTVLKGDTVSLECSAVGNPIPKVVWFKKNGQLPTNRIKMINGSLIINNVISSDEAIYVCNHTNSYGTISREITLIYNEEPSIDCPTNKTDPKQGEFLDLICTVRGVPPPHNAWFLNGFSVLNDSLVEVRDNRINFTRVEKRHAGNLQLFARNVVKTVYSSIMISVIPLGSIDTFIAPTRPHKKHSSKRPPKRPSKPPKLIPPSKPVITRMDDESVVVRWNVSQDTGLPISFFKVQYRELGPANSNAHNGSSRPSRWKTTNVDIQPNIRNYDITNLKPDYIYRFRIAAVYQNNDNKLSPNSDKFHLERYDFDDRNPLPTPIIIETETVSTTAVKIHWKCDNPKNVQIDGFYISFISASTAGDYMKATADGKDTREYVITHLQPDSIYDVKLQSFNSKYASDFSGIMKAKTGALQLVSTTTTQLPSQPTSRGEKSEFSLYVIVAGVVIGCALLVCAITVIFVCRKWQQKKSVDNRDKTIGEDHTLQLDGNEYVVVSPKSNGHTPNRITITANPLADADNKVSSGSNQLLLLCDESEHDRDVLFECSFAK